MKLYLKIISATRPLRRRGTLSIALAPSIFSERLQARPCSEVILYFALAHASPNREGIIGTLPGILSGGIKALRRLRGNMAFQTMNYLGGVARR